VPLGRASSYYGPGGLRSSYGAQVFGAAVQGGPVQWIGPLDVPQTMSYLPDVARALAVLGEHDAADGRAWHLPAAAPLTGDRFLRLITGAAGAPHDIRAADRAAIEHLAAHDPFLAEVAEIYFQVEEPWLVDHSDFMTTFGPFEVTAHARAVAATVAWFRAAPDLR
jgi:nucleoside-diphosphate-sugar epimerase